MTDTDAKLALGIETSCDETAAAVVDITSRNILSSVVYSQFSEHVEYGGVVPEIASRAHAERLPEIVSAALEEAGKKLTDMTCITATTGPGLLGGLLVGTSFAKSLSLSSGVPFVATNHLEGHALTAQLAENAEFPYLLLLVSGGHCQFINVRGLGDYEELGGTLDDAIGECFDKSAKLLGLPYPGGPELEKLAHHGNPNAYKLPMPKNDSSLDFSFSGLKTAVRNLVKSQEELDEQICANIAASLQLTIANLLIKKVGMAIDTTRAKRFVLAGGVAANKMLRSKLEELCQSRDVEFFAPPIKLCTDNAAMIAYAGGLNYVNSNKASPLNTKPTPRWPLSNL